MKSSFKTNIVLAGTLIIFSVFAYWYEFRKKIEIQKRDDAKTKLFAFDSNAEFDRLHIVEKNSKVNFEFHCLNNCKLSSVSSQWVVTAPIEFKADESNVGSFISNVSNALVSERIPLESDTETKLAGFGLSSAQRDSFKVEIFLKAAQKPYTVYFGDNAPVGENLYAYATKPEEQMSKEVLILPAYLKASLQKGLSYWRNKRIFTFTQSDVEGFLLNSKISVTKKDGTWFCKQGSGPNLLGDSQTIEAYVTGLVFMNTSDYVSDDRQKDAAKLGINREPTQSIEISLKDKTRLKLSLYELNKNKEIKIYATLSNQNYVLELDKTSTEKFKRELSSFKYKRLITVADKERIKKAKVDFISNKEKKIKESLELTLANAVWKVSAGALAEFDSLKFDRALQRFGSATIAEFISSNKIPKEAELSAEWTFYDENSKMVKEYKIFTHGADMFVKLNADDAVRMEHGEENQVSIKSTDFKK